MPASAFAQGDLGRISGLARDSRSAFVTDARVLVKNEKTGEERTAQTGVQGFFVIGSLKPSTYTVNVEKTGSGRSSTSQCRWRPANFNWFAVRQP